MMNLKKTKLLAVLFFCISFLFSNAGFSLAQSDNSAGSIKEENNSGQKLEESQEQSDKDTQESKAKKKKKKKKKGKKKRKNSGEKESAKETGSSEVGSK
ncbi:MAG: hypothetical protein PHY56_03240 [Candidatus Omnitrophica bacterium]|nr:hypothetical protein [Candidatus Omnitrophota bacterium]